MIKRKEELRGIEGELLKTNEWRSKTMNIETIDNQFDTRACTLLRYYTALLERSRNKHVAF